MLTVQGTLGTVKASSVSNLAATYANGAAGVGATLTSTVSVALVLDGIAMSVGDRVLVPVQTAQLQNGVYEVTDSGSGVTPWILTRASDYDNSVPGQVKEGMFVFVELGTVNSGSSWLQTSTGTVLGTDAVLFTESNYVQYSFLPGAAVFVVNAAGFGIGLATVSGTSMTQTTPTNLEVKYSVVYSNTSRPSVTVPSAWVFATLDAAWAYYQTVIS